MPVFKITGLSVRRDCQNYWLLITNVNIFVHSGTALMFKFQVNIGVAETTVIQFHMWRQKKQNKSHSPIMQMRHILVPVCLSTCWHIEDWCGTPFLYLAPEDTHFYNWMNEAALAALEHQQDLCNCKTGWLLLESISLPISDIWHHNDLKNPHLRPHISIFFF